MRLTAPRAAHQREGHERFTLDRILAEEAAVLDLVDARDDRALAVDQRRTTPRGCRRTRSAPCENIGRSPVAGATAVRAGRGGQDHLDARLARRRAPPPRRRVLVLAPDRQGRRRRGARRRRRRRATPIAKALQSLRDKQLCG